MKIGITCYPTYGGSGVVASELGLELAKKGHEVHFISYELPFRLARYQENIFFHGVEVMLYPLFKYPPYTLALAAKMAEVVREHDLELLHVHYAIPHAICAYLAKAMLKAKAPKVVTTLHGTDITLVGYDKSFFQITKFGIEESEGITAVSEYLKQETLEKFCTACQVEVIPNFVDTTRFMPFAGNACCDRKHFARPDEAVLMHVSNFRPTKRVPDVVEIFAKVRKERKAKLLLIGDGPEMPRVVEKAQALGVQEDVVYLGKQDPLEHLLGIADVFLMPSETESFGLAGLEAMACGVPVVGSRIGGLPELVVHGECGYLEPMGDTDAMARRVLELLGDRDKLAAFGANARERTVQRFEAQNIVPLYERYYREVMEGKCKG
jgi:N-acetyl-alpha-D-glucosaminyl L-malate synthase BshA